MAQDPQTPMDEELQRAARDAEPQPETPEGEVIEDILDATDVAAESEGELIDNPEAEMLAAQVEELEQAVKEAKDQALRSAAEAQNARRRAEQDAEKARKFALEKFVKEMLPVVDSLEKALESMSDDEAAKAHVEGIEMTLKMQLDALNKSGVEQLDPHGEPFDPEYHQAVAMVPSPDAEPNSVIDVMQKGYTLNGRLVRPAMVAVSKAN
ncbi:nucleotide exchange factor GrpE [Cobetia marina]|jgi:molecular chaperone GrpE|uniref:Protein GrpE n=1 Tax=Cobetia marina TaxID=28258 RepID=A0ABU9GJ32_COBMA|nr:MULTISPECIES: nucleotide exchange factor GrpE [Cobetia]AOM02567.1 nucleotide exchange factor GrpE [Cobetia marina]AZV32365.1 nucleotide exchange factor GrpE [Cobetia sp. ICG0124]MDA5563880.1 nucleotide exchange factor GrpE [Cobetia sp. MMG027]MDH2291848.1 nucleotide exchange factor GrpE [Cobetia sp. 10Alg 146]MDH2374383.1 nucleotide exchange factor GrpE [Cobetia sp. 3AK]